jgi:hypothetical protein
MPSGHSIAQEKPELVIVSRSWAPTELTMHAHDKKGSRNVLSLDSLSAVGFPSVIQFESNGVCRADITVDVHHQATYVWSDLTGQWSVKGKKLTLNFGVEVNTYIPTEMRIAAISREQVEFSFERERGKNLINYTVTCKPF